VRAEPRQEQEAGGRYVVIVSRPCMTSSWCGVGVGVGDGEFGVDSGGW
jgi:hypothetical protein